MEKPQRELGFLVFGGCGVWLREGDRDGGVEEFEGAALGGGGFGELVEFGAVDVDAVAGEGGQVGQQGAEGADGLVGVVAVAGCLAAGGGRAGGGGDGVVPVGRFGVGVGQRGQRGAEVPDEVGG